jgi:hypothetical protein
MWTKSVVRCGKLIKDERQKLMSNLPSMDDIPLVIMSLVESDESISEFNSVLT